jgi:hypothetical protein
MVRSSTITPSPNKGLVVRSGGARHDPPGLRRSLCWKPPEKSPPSLSQVYLLVRALTEPLRRQLKPELLKPGRKSFHAAHIPHHRREQGHRPRGRRSYRRPVAPPHRLSRRRRFRRARAIASGRTDGMCNPWRAARKPMMAASRSGVRDARDHSIPEYTLSLQQYFTWLAHTVSCRPISESQQRLKSTGGCDAFDLFPFAALRHAGIRDAAARSWCRRHSCQTVTPRSRRAPPSVLIFLTE